MLEQLGRGYADGAEILAKIQDALKAENAVAGDEHQKFKLTFNDLLECSKEHQNALQEVEAAMTRARLSHIRLLDILSELNRNLTQLHTERTTRIAEIVGEEPVATIDVSKAA